MGVSAGLTESTPGSGAAALVPPARTGTGEGAGRPVRKPGSFSDRTGAPGVREEEEGRSGAGWAPEGSLGKCGSRQLRFASQMGCSFLTRTAHTTRSSSEVGPDLGPPPDGVFPGF